MTKYLLIASVLLLNIHTVLAVDLKCQVEPGLNTELISELGDEQFTIYNYETEEPGISIDGGLFDGPKIENGQYLVSFSNECDNMIDIAFVATEFADLKIGKRRSIKGQIVYAYSGFENVENDEVKAVINCQP